MINKKTMFVCLFVLWVSPVFLRTLRGEGPSLVFTLLSSELKLKLGWSGKKLRKVYEI